MFGTKTIKINGVPYRLDKAQIEELLASRRTFVDSSSTWEAKHDEMKRERDVLQERLDAANAKLHDYGHMSGF